MNMGWYVVYLLMCFANGLMCGIHDFAPNTWQFWVWTGIIALTFVSGSNYRKG